MALTETRYQPYFPLPSLYEIERDQVLQCPVYYEGALAAPSSGTITIYDDDGTEVVSAAAITVSNSIATYTFGSSLTEDDLGEGWVEEWALVMPDGVTHTFRNDAAVVRRRLYPVISDADLFKRESALDPNGNDPITSLANFQGYIDEADVEVQRRLIREGNRPNLIISPSSLRDAWLYLTLHLIFEDLSTRLNPAYADKARNYEHKFERAWGKMAFLYDSDDDGTPDSATDRRGAMPTYWLSGRPSG